MRQVFSAGFLTRKSAQHPWRTIGIWLASLGVAIALMVTLLGDALSTDVTTLTNNPESARADRLLEERLGASSATFGEIVVITSPELTVDDAEFQQFAEQLNTDLTALGDQIVISGTTFWTTGDESLLSADRHTTLLSLTLPDDASESIAQVHQIVEEAATAGDFELLVTGEATLDLEITEAAEKDLAKGEAIGISLALVILALVFGAIVAALLPIVLAIAAIIISLGATALLGQFIDLPVIVINLMTMLGLAVGIDYSLFVVSRFREERSKGRETVDAIAASGSTAGRTVVISGLTVAAALAGMLIMPDTSNQAIGAGAVLIVLATVLTSLTLLPALLSILGDRVNALRIPLPRRSQNPDSAESAGGFWNWTTKAVMRRPLISLVLAGGLLLAAAASIVDMDQGEIGIAAMPDGLMSKDAYILLEQEFGFGQDLPAIVVIDGHTDDPAVKHATLALQQAISDNPAFAGGQLDLHPDANLAVLNARLSGDALSNEAMDAVTLLRAELVPAAFDGVPADVLVTGKTAMTIDLTDATNAYMPFVFAFVLGLSFVVLMVAFHSIVVPIKAILMNLLSVAAAYGLLVLVFQKGVGAGLFGFQQVEVIQTGLPLFLFAVLFGLSMDYHVFLLSRIRERFLETGDNTDAVAYGLRSTGRLITGAALIMVAVFGGFALGDLVPMQQMGFGLAVAVLVDATLIRCVLVPASMQLLGDWNWYLPNFLSWLPNLQIESPASVVATNASGD